MIVGGLTVSLTRPVCSTRLYPLVSFLASNWKNHTLRVTDRLTGRIVSVYIFCLGPVLGSMDLPFSRPETKPFLAVIARPQPQSRCVIAGSERMELSKSVRLRPLFAFCLIVDRTLLLVIILR